MIVLKDLTLVERANAQVVRGKWGETSHFEMCQCSFFVFGGRQFSYCTFLIGIPSIKKMYTH